MRVAPAPPPMLFIATDISRTCKEREIYEALLPLDGARILELGCGQAEHTRAIADAHPTATILAAEVDRIQHEANLASPRPANLSFASFGAEAIDCPDASVDVVLMFKSLHHVPAPQLDTALAEIRRVLRPGGYAYLSEPLYAGPFNELIRIFNDEAVVRRQAFDAIRRAIDAGTFTLASETFFNVPLHYPDFSAFEARHFVVTFVERNVTDAQAALVRKRFEDWRQPDGVRLTQAMRVDLLRAPA